MEKMRDDISVMRQTMQEMMRAQQERLMAVEAALCDWTVRLMARETTVNERLVWLQERVMAMDEDNEEEEEDEEDESTTSTEVDEGSPVVLDSDLDDFGSPELRPTLERWGDMGGRVNRFVRIEEEPLDEVETLILSGVAPSYDDRVVHRLVPIEDVPPYEDSPRYSSVEL